MLLAVLTLVPAVAVMPFKDLSGGRGQAGEALRETVTSDLRGVSGLRVIDRAEIDRIIAEQKLQARERDLDAAGSIRVGTLLGATWIVAGAYQRAGAEVRLTARFVDVATGEVKGTAKVDGPEREILSLQDRVTVELLRSIGLAPREAQKFTRRARAKVRGLRTLELYGDAVVEPDEQKRAKLLQATLDGDPAFEYAARDLEALQRRLRAYSELHAQAAANDLQSQYARTMKALEDEKDPAKRYMPYLNAMSFLQSTQRFHRLQRVARRAIADAPPPPQYQTTPIGESAQMYLVVAAAGLDDQDGVLREGELFLAKYAKSGSFDYVKGRMERAIEVKRRRAEGAAKAEASLARAHDGDVCFAGKVYKDYDQLTEARARLEEGLQRGCRMKPADIASILIDVAILQRDPAAARRFTAKLQSIDPERARKRGDVDIERLFPTDDND